MKNDEVKISGKIREVTPIYVGGNNFPAIIASVGLSGEKDSLQTERLKIERAINAGANIITDHSLVNNISEIHKSILEKFNIPISAITAYELSVLSQRKKIKEKDFIKCFEKEAKRGLDLLTIHATVYKNDAELLKKSMRTIPCTSRGGTMVLEILQKLKCENPFYIYFDEILDIAKEYSITLSLGTCYRPASVCDCNEKDFLYFMEIERMSNLVKKAIKKGVSIIVEGIGHSPINKMPDIISKSKKICFNVPYRVLPVATDIALGYDHISSAIGGAVAVYNGADMITCVSRSEHIGLPTLDDLEEAVISAKIAAHCGFSARMNEFDKDYEMSIARSKFGCHGILKHAIFPEGAKKALIEKKRNGDEKKCTMCGKFCALEASDRILF